MASFITVQPTLLHGTHGQKDSVFGLMLCCCRLEPLSNVIFESVFCEKGGDTMEHTCVRRRQEEQESSYPSGCPFSGSLCGVPWK